MNQNIKVHFSSKTDMWATPQDLFDKLNEMFVLLKKMLSVFGTSQKSRMV